MILTITSDSALTLKLSNLYRQEQYFSYFTDHEHLFDIIAQRANIIKLCIIDCRSISSKTTDLALTSISERIPNVDIITIAKNSNYCRKPYSHLQISDPFFNEKMKELLTKLYKNRRTDSCMISHDKYDKVLLLGYPMNLTSTERRILMLLSEYPKNVFTPSDISHLVGLKNSKSVAVHISSINKKAVIISERPLILSKYSLGYHINPHP